MYADRRERGRGLFLLPSEINFAPIGTDRPYIIAGVSQYALYLFQRLWRPDFNVEQAKALAAFLIVETSRLDPKVGPTPDMTILERTGPTSLDESAIEVILKGNDERFKKFAESFRTELV